MGKEQELIKAVKAKDLTKVQKILTSSSMKRKGEEAVWQNVDTGHKIRKLLSHIDVNARDTDSGSTPLILSVLAGLRDMAEMLIFYSANVLAQDLKGNSALHMAVFGGRLDLINLLLANNADVNAVNDDQNSPLHVACRDNAKATVISRLVQAGADVWLQNKDNLTSLDTAAMYNRLEAASVLLDSCPSLISNQRAAVEAAMRDNVAVLELLLEHGVDPNQLDSVTGSSALCEAVRFGRIKATELLLDFGAEVKKVNSKLETPFSLSTLLPTLVQQRLQAVFEEYKDHQPRIPKFLVQKNDEMSDSFRLRCLKDYPVLPSLRSWTQNTRLYCSSCTEANNNRHVIDDNPTTFWVIPECHDAWTVLDLGNPHIITGITIVGWNSPQMVKTFELQASEFLQGPWTAVAVHTCKLIGSSNPRDPGAEQTFKGFTVKVRYLRVYIVDNHGGSSINFQGIQLHGADSCVFELLQSFGKKHLAETFIQNGINTYQRLIDATDAQIATFIDDLVEVFELYQFLQEHRRKVYPLTLLDWLIVPPHSCYTNEDVEDFRVQANPNVSEAVQVQVEGAELEGTVSVRLQPTGKDSASVATFHGLRIKTVGRFLISVKAQTTNMILNAPDHIEVRPPKRNADEIGAAFDEIQEMLKGIQETL